MTCNAVESETNKALTALYPTEIESGKLVFKSVNLDEDTSEADATRCKASGQSLLIIYNGEKTDLTSIAFMNASNKPEKLKAEIEKVIKPLLALK
jgi:CO dehydrogenase/acetyl-CoA synthase gamma subunit (corrinoid Fe-S protein)